MIADLRQAAGLSQHQLADRSGVTRSVLANVEVGRHGATIATLTKLAGPLDTTVAALLGEESRDAVPAALVAQIANHQQRITAAMRELGEILTDLQTESDRISQILARYGADRPACSCCGRQVAPLDSRGRCGHCGFNRYNGTHDGEEPCRPGSGT